MSAPKETEDEKIARIMGINPQAVKQSRDKYDNDPIIQHLLKARIEDIKTELRLSLEEIKPERLLPVQESIKILTRAQSAIKPKIL